MSACLVTPWLHLWMSPCHSCKTTRSKQFLIWFLHELLCTRVSLNSFPSTASRCPSLPTSAAEIFPLLLVTWYTCPPLTYGFLLTRKLSPTFVGPFKVLESVGAVSYRLELPPEFGTIHPVFHISQLKLHQGTPPLSRAALFVPDTSQQEWEVECLLDKHLRRNTVQYLVHWKGYGPLDATWEPASNLANA